MKKNIYNIIFFCCLLLGWSNSCFGGDATPSEVFPGYIQEKYAPESFPGYKKSWEASFEASQREMKNSEKNSKVKKLLEKFRPLKEKGLNKKSLNKIQGSIVFSLEYVKEKDNDNNWQTLGQFLESEKGDCEEFAIAEILVIKDLFPEAEVYFVFGYKKAILLGDDEDHSVAVVKIQDKFFIMDIGGDVVVNTEEEDKGFIPYLMIDIQSGGFYALYPEEFFHGQIARAE